MVHPSAKVRDNNNMHLKGEGKVIKLLARGKNKNHPWRHPPGLSIAQTPDTAPRDSSRAQHPSRAVSWARRGTASPRGRGRARSCVVELALSDPPRRVCCPAERHRREKGRGSRKRRVRVRRKRSTVSRSPNRRWRRGGGGLHYRRFFVSGRARFFRTTSRSEIQSQKTHRVAVS